MAIVNNEPIELDWGGATVLATNETQMVIHPSRRNFTAHSVQTLPCEPSLKIRPQAYQPQPSSFLKVDAEQASAQLPNVTVSGTRVVPTLARVQVGNRGVWGTHVLAVLFCDNLKLKSGSVLINQQTKHVLPFVIAKREPSASTHPNARIVGRAVVVQDGDVLAHVECRLT